MELVVLKDLEFLALQKHPDYTHLPNRSPVREIESELSGTLTKNGVSGQIISESQAAQWNREAEEVRAKVQAKMEQYRPALGNGESVVREVEAEPVVEQQVPQATKKAGIAHRPGDEKHQA